MRVGVWAEGPRALLHGADEWRFDVVDGAFAHGGGRALVFAVAPPKVYAYDRDEPGAATRYRF